MPTLCNQLKGHQLLLVLDNCEHLVQPAADLCVALLSECPAVTILATSRELLAVPGEVVYPVPPLSLPGAGAGELADSDAVALFTERTRAVDPDFAVTSVNAAAVQEICRRLDGIPLALELAAARMRVLGAAQVADRLGERLSLLGGGRRGAVSRHQTLRAAIDWSHDLLEPPERAMLARLSVFPGTFDLAAAEAFAADDGPSGRGFENLDLLSRLVDKSLVVVSHDRAEVRYSLLETVREYAAEKLAGRGEIDAMRDRHRDLYLAPAQTSPRGVDTWADRLRLAERELDNYRAALNWSLERGDLTAVLELTAFVLPYWVIVGVEDMRWLEHALAAPGPAAAAAEIRCVLTSMPHDGGGSAARMTALRAEALEFAAASGDLDVVGRISMWLSEVDLGAGDPQRAEATLADARAAFDEAGSAVGQAWCEHQLALLRFADNDVAAAGRHLDTAIALVGPDGDEWFTPHAFATRALVAALAGEPGSDTLADEGLRVARGLPWGTLLAMSLTRAAQAAVLSGQMERAGRLLGEELLPLLRDLGVHRWVCDGLELSALVLAPDSPTAAVAVLGAASALRSQMGQGQGGGILARHIDAARVALMEALGAACYAEHDRQGRLRSSAQALVFARDCLGGSAQP